MPQELQDFSLDRMVNAVERVRERLLRASSILRASNVPFAVVGGNAVALWVSRVDPAAVRNTQDVDILIRRVDFEAATEAFCRAGFLYRHSSGIDMFLDGPTAKARDAVRLVFAGEKVRPLEEFFNPDVTESEDAGEYRVLSLSPLVRIKLTAFRDKDRMHLRDMLDVRLIDATWYDQLPEELAARLRHLIETPEG